MKTRIGSQLVRLAMAAAITLVAASGARAQEGGIALGAEAPSAHVMTLDGAMADLEKMYGDKPVVLEFWATWCPLCKKLEPTLQAAREKYAGKVTFIGVGVSSNQTAAKQKQYIEQQRLTGEYVFDGSDAAVKAFMAPHTSYIVVLDRHHKVVYTGVGPTQDIDAAVKRAIDASM
jgi:thiol-disulfide isomerase/thioredoxin